MHVASLIHFLAATIGWAAVFVCLLLYIKNRKPLTLHITLFSVSLLLMVSGIAVDHYALVTGIQLGRTATIVSGAIGANLFVIIVPPLLHRLFGLEFKGFARTVCIGVDVLVVCASVLYVFVWHVSWLFIVLQLSLYSVLLCGILFGFVNVGNAGSKEIRLFLKTIFMTAVLFSPFLALDSFMGESPLTPYNLALPLMVLVESVVVAVFAVLYLDQPAFMKENRLTDHCVEVLKLTAREKEIVESLLVGRTNKEISDNLCISFKTVENHLYNIYQKAGVKNRTQLANLIHTNSAS